MRNLLVILMLIITGGTFAQGKKTEWENPEIFGINKEPTRATFLPYQSEKAAIADDYSKSDWYLSLNGTYVNIFGQDLYKKSIILLNAIF